MYKNAFFILSEIEIESGKRFAYAEKVPNCYNLFNYFTPHNGCKIESINACDTFKNAKETAELWNDAYKRNGFYLFA